MIYDCTCLICTLRWLQGGSVLEQGVLLETCGNNPCEVLQLAGVRNDRAGKGSFKEMAATLFFSIFLSNRSSVLLEGVLSS